MQKDTKKGPRRSRHLEEQSKEGFTKLQWHLTRANNRSMKGYFVNWEDTVSKYNSCSLSFPENPLVPVNYPVLRSSIQGRVASGGPDMHNRLAKIYDFAWLSAVKSIVLLAKYGTTRSKPTSEPFSYFRLSPICPTGTRISQTLSAKLFQTKQPPSPPDDFSLFRTRCE